MSYFNPTDMPHQPSSFDAGEPLSLVDRHSSFEGSFATSRDIRIEGKASGTISSAGTVVIAEGASVTATIEAEHLIVSGDLMGEVRCRGRLQVSPTGRLRGKVSTAILVIDEGAVYEGELDMGAATSKFRSFGNEPVPITAATSAQAAPSNSTTFIRRLGGPETAWNGQPGSEQPAASPENDDAARS